MERKHISKIDRVDSFASNHRLDGKPGDEAVVFREVIAAVRSSGFAATHVDILSQPMALGGIGVSQLRAYEPQVGNLE